MSTAQVSAAPAPAKATVCALVCVSVCALCVHARVRSCVECCSHSAGLSLRDLLSPSRCQDAKIKRLLSTSDGLKDLHFSDLHKQAAAAEEDKGSSKADAGAGSAVVSDAWWLVYFWQVCRVQFPPGSGLSVLRACVCCESVGCQQGCHGGRAHTFAPLPCFIT